MSAYIARRIFLMLPTLLGILFVSFVVVQFAPGGPVERVIAQINGADTGGTSRVSGGGGDFGRFRRGLWNDFGTPRETQLTPLFFGYSSSRAWMAAVRSFWVAARFS